MGILTWRSIICPLGKKIMKLIFTKKSKNIYALGPNNAMRIGLSHCFAVINPLFCSLGYNIYWSKIFLQKSVDLLSMLCCL